MIPYNKYTGEGNGFSFANFNAHEMLYTLRTALKCYDNKEIWDNLVIKAMNTRIDWKTQAGKYISLYNELVI